MRRTLLLYGLAVLAVAPATRGLSAQQTAPLPRVTADVRALAGCYRLTGWTHAAVIPAITSYHELPSSPGWLPYRARLAYRELVGRLHRADTRAAQDEGRLAGRRDVRLPRRHPARPADDRRGHASRVPVEALSSCGAPAAQRSLNLTSELRKLASLAFCWIHSQVSLGVMPITININDERGSN